MEVQAQNFISKLCRLLRDTSLNLTPNKSYTHDAVRSSKHLASS